MTDSTNLTRCKIALLDFPRKHACSYECIYECPHDESPVDEECLPDIYFLDPRHLHFEEKDA